MHVYSPDVDSLSVVRFRLDVVAYNATRNDAPREITFVEYYKFYTKQCTWHDVLYNVRLLVHVYQIQVGMIEVGIYFDREIAKW